MEWILPIKGMASHYPFDFYISFIIYPGLVVIEVFGDGVEEGVVYAFLPFFKRHPVEGIASPIVERGFGVVHSLEMEGGFIGVF